MKETMFKYQGEIIGNGDIANALKEIHVQPKLYFASGVSNSQETRESEYQREIELLMKQESDKHLVYFSSLSVFYSDTRYTRHKRQMETAVRAAFPKYTIVRLGNITWGNNPHTLINTLRDRLNSGQPLEIQDTTRYIIDKDEFHHWMKLIPNWCCELNLTGQPMKIKDIVRKYVL